MIIFFGPVYIALFLISVISGLQSPGKPFSFQSVVVYFKFCPGDGNVLPGHSGSVHQEAALCEPAEQFPLDPWFFRIRDDLSQVTTLPPRHFAFSEPCVCELTQITH